MGFIYHHLGDSDVRIMMVDQWESEWAALAAAGGPAQCYGKQLTSAGWRRWETVMPDALTSRDDDWLVNEMDDVSYWQPFLTRKTKSGQTRVDYDKPEALEKLCRGEFNIAYIRGLAHALIARGETDCLIYRAGTAIEDRSECSGWESQTVPLADVIAGHRVRYYPSPGDRLAWSVPTGPNCHHSIRAL